MDAKELTDWLGKEESAGAGWSKDDGSGELVTALYRRQL